MKKESKGIISINEYLENTVYHQKYQGGGSLHFLAKCHRFHIDIDISCQ